MSTSTELCGCKHDGRQWLVTCPPHHAEWKERHERAQRDLKRDVAAPQPDWLQLPKENAA